MLDAYTSGQVEAMEALGFIKTAAGKAHLLGRMANWSWKKMPTWHGVKKTMIGNPRKFMDEVASGRATAKGSLLRESFHTPTMLSKAMFYGYPAYESGSVMLDDKGDKARRVGESIGGAAAGLAAYSPFGLLGSMAADPLGRRVGGAIGQTAGYLGDKANNMFAGKKNLGEQQQPAYTSNENVNTIGQKTPL